MNALLIGFAISLLATVIVGGYLVRRAVAQRQLVDLEDAIPEWVNRGTGVWPPIVVDLDDGFFDRFIDTVDTAIRQQQLEDAAPWN